MDALILDNSVRTWLVALATALGGMLLLRVVLALLVRQLGRLSLRTETKLDNLLVAVLRATGKLFTFVLPLLLGLSVLELPATLARVVSIATTILVWLQVAVWITAGVREWAAELVRRRAADLASTTTLAVLRIGILVAVWAIVSIALLDNLGVNISALVAGLGIGGVALALAVQGIFADLVASLVIVLDKPFVIGDYLIVGEHQGTVEAIGLKTTRIRSLGGEEIVFSHSDLLASRIRNYKRMSERRIAFRVGVTYQTSRAELDALPAAIEAIVRAQDKARFERCHLATFGDSAIEYEIVYHVLEPDYRTYMDVQHALNLALFDAFAERGVEFAYPTQTLHLVSPPPPGETAPTLPLDEAQHEPIARAAPLGGRAR